MHIMYMLGKRALSHNAATTSAITSFYEHNSVNVQRMEEREAERERERAHFGHGMMRKYLLGKHPRMNVVKHTLSHRSSVREDQKPR